MEYLVVAPLTVPPQLTVVTVPASEADSGTWGPWGPRTMRTRNTYEAQDLLATWTTLVEEHELPGGDGVARSVSMVSIQNTSVLTFRLSTPDAPGLTAVAAEEACNRAVEHLLDAVLGRECRVRWINRTLLTSAPSDAPPNWLSDRTVEVHLGQRDDDRGDTTSSLGWGNNLLVGYEALPAVEQQEVRSGLVDSQVIWVSLESIAHRSATVARQQAQGSPPGRQDVLATGRDAEALLTEISTHNLLYDDMALNIQGQRRKIAQAILTAWRYHEIAARIDNRVRNIEQIAARQRDRLDAAYQGAVEKVLAFLGIVSGTQLLLAVVGLAFAGNVKAQPGGDRRGIMYMLRVVNTDVWLLLATALVVGLFAYLNLLRRRAR